MATFRTVAIRCAAVAATTCGAASIASACASFAGDDAPVDGGEAGTDASSEGAPTGDGGTDATPPCDESMTASDPNHCGKCGHSCLGGACVAGDCKPAVLATITATTVIGPVLDATRAVVVVLDGGVGSQVAWCAKTGCAAPLPGVALPTYPASPKAMASDGTSAYVGTSGGNNGAVYRIGQDGAARLVVPTGGMFQSPDNFAIFGTDLFFLAAYQAPPIGLFRVPLDGSQAAAQVVPVQPADRWLNTAVIAGAMYVNDFQSIARCAGTSCAALQTFVAPNVSHLDLTGMVTDGTSIFWTSDSKLLLSCAAGVSCAAPATLVGEPSFEGGTPIALSIHGGDLYVTTDAGNIYTCTTAMCGPTFHRFATDQVIEGAAVADDGAVYWVARDRAVAVADAADEAGTSAGPVAHRLMRLAK